MGTKKGEWRSTARRAYEGKRKSRKKSPMDMDSIIKRMRWFRNPFRK
jgi:hypothetical protein